jgi:hypothetical protein
MLSENVSLLNLYLTKKFVTSRVMNVTPLLFKRFLTLSFKCLSFCLLLSIYFLVFSY